MTTAAKVAVIKANPAPGFSEWHPALKGNVQGGDAQLSDCVAFLP